MEVPHMFKENGRLKPKENHEFSNISKKKLTCPNCKSEYVLDNPVFGEVFYCKKCDHVPVTD